MSEEIQVGEYVRTDKGKIAKVLYFEKKQGAILNPYSLKLDYYKDYMTVHTKEEIEDMKHSFNIIDLIEVGDYVNGRLVLQVDYKNKNLCLLVPLTDTRANTNICWYGYEDVKSIVTKEQFKSVEYEVE